ncbi:MAG: ABC transporter ATP-binding protein [Lachnospiraceae bacterium]|nr:ABC transporter ATP-binding protein [Lachnospiraceae bacterium]
MIRFNNVSFQYGEEVCTDQSTISGIDLNIEDGQVVVITGESGCGKTTIGRLVNGLSPHFYAGQLQGEVSVEGTDPSTRELYETARYVGSIFQNPRTQFFNVDTTSEITFSCENQGMDPDEIRERLSRVVENLNISNLLDRSIFQLSGGQKQKIACASIAMSDAGIIVMDEPSSNLDLQGIEDLKQVIETWKSQGKTILIAEHRLYYLKDLVDRLVIMKEGRIHSVLDKSRIGQLSGKEMQAMGLRTFSMEDLFRQDLPKKKDLHQNASGREMHKCTAQDFAIRSMRFRYGRSGEGILIRQTDLRAGEITALVGLNGAGKSTFAKCLCGLNKKSKEDIRQGGKVLNKAARVRKSFLVMQDVNTQLFADSVLNEVLLSLREKYGKAYDPVAQEKEAMDILRMMDLEEFRDRHPISLSGGQKQRVAIAGAIAADKELIVFDEPTSGLDYKHMAEVSSVMKLLANMGKTIVVITHDMELILSAMDRVICLERGEVVDDYALTDDTKRRLYEYFYKVTGYGSMSNNIGLVSINHSEDEYERQKVAN